MTREQRRNDEGDEDEGGGVLSTCPTCGSPEVYPSVYDGDPDDRYYCPECGESCFEVRYVQKDDLGDAYDSDPDPEIFPPPVEDRTWNEYNEEVGL